MRKHKLRTLKTILYLSTILLILSLSFLFYWKVLRMSYYSYVYNCVPNAEQTLDDKNLIVAGTTYISTNLTSNLTGKSTTQFIVQNINCNYKVGIYLNPNSSTRTLRHEICHFNQAKDCRIKGCDDPLGNYLNEVECYTKENIPRLYSQEINEVFIQNLLL